MTKLQYYGILLIVILTIIVLGVGWEFWAEDLLGPLFIENFTPESVDERWEYVLSIAAFSAIALLIPALVGSRLIAQQQILTDELTQLAENDYLTGLYNRCKLTERLEVELARHQRFNRALSVVLIDVDYFKKTNDTMGHYAGDRLLKSISARIVDTIRSVDIPGRWGGEEFLVICPETDLQGATQLAEKLCQSIGGTPFGELGSKTVSCGVAAVNTDTKLVTLMNRVDKALYTAKHAGRNQVAVAA
ncbi:MAG: GGDEF domain-containing protein [Gammaproteobacteria bacterium]